MSNASNMTLKQQTLNSILCFRMINCNGSMEWSIENKYDQIGMSTFIWTICFEKFNETIEITKRFLSAFRHCEFIIWNRFDRRCYAPVAKQNIRRRQNSNSVLKSIYGWQIGSIIIIIITLAASHSQCRNTRWCTASSFYVFGSQLQIAMSQ